jgi:hypothetical protein
MPDKNLEERATYLALTSLFLGVLAAIGLKNRRAGDVLDLPPKDLAMLGLATYRLARLASFDKVLEPVRLQFAEVKPDQFGADNTVEPKGEGAQRAVGELICCPICTGTWIAAALTYGLCYLPGPTRLLITIMGAIGMGELLHNLTEALHWKAWEARKHVGQNQG